MFLNQLNQLRKQWSNDRTDHSEKKIDIDYYVSYAKNYALNISITYYAESYRMLGKSYFYYIKTHINYHKYRKQIEQIQEHGRL